MLGPCIKHAVTYHTPYTAFAAFSMVGLAVIAYTQPSPTASYSRLRVRANRLGEEVSGHTQHEHHVPGVSDPP
jgi:hypothetical protein